MVSVGACKVVRFPSGACPAIRARPARRHDHALSNHIRGVLKTFGMLPGAGRGLPFDRRVETLLADQAEVAPIVRLMLAAWRQLRQQTAIFDKAVRVLVKSNPICRHLMGVPGIGVLSVLAYVSMVEDPARFGRSRSVGAHL